jgi:hypothetical protein
LPGGPGDQHRGFCWKIGFFGVRHWRRRRAPLNASFTTAGGGQCFAIGSKTSNRALVRIVTAEIVGEDLTALELKQIADIRRLLCKLICG